MGSDSADGRDSSSSKPTKEISIKADDQQLSSKAAKKSRRELVNEDVLEKYHLSQKLQGILKKPSQEVTEEGGEKIVDGVDIEKSEKPEAEPLKLTSQEQVEVDQVLNDVNQLRKKDKKKLAKEKKKFKKQQQKQKAKEEEEKEGKGEKALAYLKHWKRHREEWKFKKNYHIWLLKNWKHTNKVPDKRFKAFLKYIKSTEQKSLALQRLEKEAKSIVDSAEAEELSPNSDSNQSYERARSVLQWIV